VWIFQEGHGAGLLHITPAPLEVGIVVLMAAVVFGLSTDYEVFLLSRMVEARTRGASTAEAVTTGLARTGRVISAAAVLLIVVTGAFALSAVTTMRFVGVGMIIALLLDATIVRMLLVPAMLSLLGSAAWWAPGPLRRLQQRAGLAEYADEELFPTVSVGRHAAPDDAAPDGASPAATSAPGREDVAADLPTTSAPDEAGEARSPASGSSGSPTAPAPEPTGKASSPASGSSGSPTAPAPEPTGKASRAPASAASGGEPSPVPATTGDDQPEPPTEPAAEPATATATPAADEDGAGDPYQAVEIGATEPPTGNTGAAAASDDLQAPTVNLAPHLNAEPKQTAADTAVLEFQPTVDLVARLGSAPDDSRPCS
jgi:RND superfamily putative drug exporter